MKELWQKLRQYPALLLFFLCIFGFMLVDLCYPDRTFSDLENKNLQQRPTFNMKQLLSNQWTSTYGDYVKEQIAFRDAWIDLQSRSEALVFQKVEIGGKLIGKDKMLFTKMFDLNSSEAKLLPRNTQALAQCAARYGDKLTVLIAPSASDIYKNDLPVGAPMLDEDAYLDDIFAQVSNAGANVVDMRTSFEENSTDYLYYRTDHHWTTDGAYLAYRQFCDLRQLVPFDTASHTRTDVESFYGTNYSAARLYSVEPDILSYYESDAPMTIYSVTGDAQFAVKNTGGLYDLDKLNVRDKYAIFLYGNNGYSEIEGEGEGSILVIKDSYANCFIPFLTANYAKIGVVDFRNYAYGIDNLVNTMQYDEVLLLYNFQSFKQDLFLANLNRGV